MFESGVPPHMICMQMCAHHNINIFRSHTQAGQSVQPPVIITPVPAWPVLSGLMISDTAINQDDARDLLEICTRIQEDDDIWVAVWTGAGRGFCSGAEVSGPPQYPEPTNMNEILDEESWISRQGKALYAVDKPMIAAVNGVAAGAGMALAEGVHTAPVAVQLAEQHDVDMPITFAVAGILAGQINVDDAIERLVRRPLRSEDDHED